jgi:3-oxoacyl-[acyl-carrier-protein] synthase-3
MGLDATSIDAVIFVTQTPDHSQPNNASLLHGRLGLSKSAPAYDLSMGCSGWVTGLHQAALLCAHGGAARVLLCAGDTLSRLTNPGDRSTDPLFGDAGSATIVEKTGRSAPLHFVLGADGAGAEAIIVKQGGARQPDGALAERTDDEGNRTHDANLVMNGADVFSFTLREVPGAIEAVMRHAGYVPATTDALVLHQANRFILSTLAKKCGFTEAQTPMSVVEHFGNQSSASIPCALIHGLADRLEAGPLKIVVKADDQTDTITCAGAVYTQADAKSDAEILLQGDVRWVHLSPSVDGPAELTGNGGKIVLRSGTAGPLIELGSGSFTATPKPPKVAPGKKP